MKVISVSSFDEYLLAGLRMILADGHLVSPRGMLTKEVTNVSLVLDNPRARTVTLPRRRANVFATIAEALWILGGRNDVAFLLPYLPRYAEYSDDGVTLHGAYGARLRSWNGVDQLKQAVQLLQRDLTTRQAVIVFFDPVRDLNQPSRDLPCNSYLQFLVRGHALDLLVVQRSQDIVWGGTVDVFVLTLFQELVAGWLGVQLGTYTHVVGSLHLYERFFERAAQIVSEPVALGPSPRLYTPIACDLDRFDDILAECFALEATMRKSQFADLTAIPPGWFRESLNLLWVYHLFRQGELREADSRLAQVPASEMRRAAEVFLAGAKKGHA